MLMCLSRQTRQEKGKRDRQTFEQIFSSEHTSTFFSPSICFATFSSSPWTSIVYGSDFETEIFSSDRRRTPISLPNRFAPSRSSPRNQDRPYPSFDPGLVPAISTSSFVPETSSQRYKTSFSLALTKSVCLRKATPA